MKNNRIILGMDQWQVKCSIHQFLQFVKRKEWNIYEINAKGDDVIFYASIINRNMIRKSFDNIELVKTTGMLGFLIRQIRCPRRILSMLVLITLWYALSHVIFVIEVKGDKQESKALILNTLQEMGYTTPFYDVDIQTLKLELKKKLENNIAWLELSKSGSRYQIQFTTKDFANIERLGHDELIAQKDGVIAKFELQHGSKLVGINDFVHQGDVLVSNRMMDSGNTPKEVYVKGRVFAYTWKEVHVEMQTDSLPKPFQFFQLLLQARSEASNDLSVDESIYKENILQFQDNTGTISMDIHYTLLEDITTTQ